uniref:Type III effector HopI1 n=1 Tax=Ganoderma boninense TaxID=34458 RepID=A0A5K1K3C9_9APHY|nr:Type III effector HopI1 [Ganoderma boninense]
MGFPSRPIRATLSPVQIILGDAIVWWRAWIVCARKTWVLCLAVTLLLGTAGTSQASSASFSCPSIQLRYRVPCMRASLAASCVAAGIGITETAQTCSTIRRFQFASGATTYIYAIDGALFHGNPFGFFSSMVTLVTNVAATAVIGHQAWCVPPSRSTLAAQRR